MALQDLSCDGSCSGCDQDCGDIIKPGSTTLTLTLDDDTEIDCAILTTFEAQNHEYIALLPLDENGENEDGEVFLYRYSVRENGQPDLANIESDEEYEAAADAFDELLDTLQFKEEAGDSDQA